LFDPVDLKLHLSTTDYGNFLANEPVCPPCAALGGLWLGAASPHYPCGWMAVVLTAASIARCVLPLRLQSPLAVSVIDDKLKEKMVAEFVHIRKQAVEPLASFLDFIT